MTTKTTIKIKNKFNQTIKELTEPQLFAAVKKLRTKAIADKEILLKAKKAQEFIKLQASLIEPGFVVELKSGGPSMTVERAVVHGSEAVANQTNKRFMCVYFNGSEFTRLLVPPEALKLVSR